MPKPTESTGGGFARVKAGDVGPNLTLPAANNVTLLTREGGAWEYQEIPRDGLQVN